MFGQHPSLKALEVRRQLLIAEAEIHRSQLETDLEIIHANAKRLSAEAKSMGSMITGAVTVVSAMREMRESRPKAESGLFSKLVKGARFASTVWQTFRPRE